MLLLSGSILSAQDRQRLSGHVPPGIARLQPLAKLSADTNLDLAIGLPLRNREALTNLLRQLYDPSSPAYHHYLTSEEFTARFGPTENQYETVIAFCRSNGFTITGTHPNRVVLDINGSVSDIERTFDLKLQFYPHPTEPRSFYAPDREPSIPPGLTILDISGLDDFMPPRPVNQIRVDRKPQVKAYATGGGPGGDFIGYDFRAAYAPGVLLTGVGQIIGLFEFGPYFTNDIILYKQAAGLPDVTVTNVLLNGFTGIPAPGTDDGEEALDIDMAMCMAPGATIIVYEGNSAIDIFNRMATDNKAKQMSCSFGFYPPPGTMDNVFLQYAAQGQTMFVASGDSGAYSTNLIFAPADDPNITSVGGTSLTTSGPRGTWVSETTWNGSGGGITPHYLIPTYQQGMNMQTNHGSTSQRNFPDVAMLAEPTIFWFLKDGQSGTVGGTSAAAPLWAGFMALVNQQAVANGRATLGNLNTTLYNIGRGSNNYSAVFRDITTGSNFNSGSPTNFPAVSGYDLCTGWGSPNGSNLINMLAAPTDSLQITPGTGFTLTTPFGVPFSPASLDLSLTNAGLAPLNWSLSNTSQWLSASSSSGTLLPASAGTTVTVSLNTDIVSNLLTGTYYANVLITNTTSGITQTRLFTLVVSGANYPLAVTGFNAGVVVPTNATIAAPQATGFDIANSYCFYQAGLNSNPQVSGSGGTQGFPQNGNFVSQSDGATIFQFGPYGSTTNALLLGKTYPNSGTLTLANPQSFNSLAILASSANGGGNGTLVINFTSGTSSPVLNFNAQDWFGSTTNVALQGFGRLHLTAGLFTENNGANNPNLYQTTINLALLGLNQPVSSVTFTKPNLGGNQNSGVFAISGSLMPSQVIITSQPQSVTNNNPAAGATISMAAMGAPPLAYQWYSGTPPSGTPVANQTNSLVFNPVTTNQAGNYFVIVSNIFNAATSSVATLTVYTAPLITQQPSPTNLILFAGQTNRFSASAIGAVPLFYSWKFNGTPIPSVTNSNYTINNLQLTNSGNYNLTVSNSYGIATSSIVSLTVRSNPFAPYATSILADHPMAYWRLGETNGTIAFDNVGGNNGTYLNVALGRPGYNPLDSDTAAGFGPSINSYVGNIPIDFASPTNATFSVEAWVNGNAQSTDAGIITKGTGAGGEQFNLDTGAASHSFRFFVRDASGGVHLANGNIAPNGKWHHLVGVCKEANGLVLLYVDGVSNASSSITAGSGLLASANPLSIGSRQSGTGSYDNQFVGTIDEVAIYNYALTTTQIQAHYSFRTNWPPSFTSNPFNKPDATAGQAYSGTIATNASDPNGDALTFTKNSGPTWLSVAANGALSGIPLSADVGTNSFLVRATDPGGLFGTATMNINVQPAPSITANVSLQGTNLLLSWTGGIAPYQVLVTTNIANPTWQTLAGPLNTNALALTPTNDDAFYRIQGQ